MTSMVSIVESSDVFLIRIFPVSTSTTSEKLRTILLSTPTSVSLLAGDELVILKVGLMVSIKSPVLKERLVLSLIPA